MINNRQNGNGNGRRRGRAGGTPRPNGSGGAPDRGSRLDNRARGNASQLHEKYKTLAADAQRQGDRVMTEYYLQFADHYFRVLSETRSRFDEQQQRRDRFEGQGDDFDDGEGEQGGDERFDERPAERGQQWPQERGEGDRETYRDRSGGQNGRGEGGNRGDGNRADGNRGDGNREGGNRSEGGRVDGNREGSRGLEGPRADAGRDRGDERGYRQPRDARDPRQPREQGDARPFREQGDQRAQRVPSDGRERQPRTPVEGQEPRLLRRERQEERSHVPVGSPPPVTAVPDEAPQVAAPVTSPAVASAPETAELPLDAPVVEARRPRGRPRKVVAPVGNDGERMEMDRLPPAFAPEPAAVEGDEAPKPRRTRRPRGETAAV